MKIQILAVGNKMPSWVSLACNDYLKRFNAPWLISLKEIKAAKRTVNRNRTEILREEEQNLRANIPPAAAIIILDERGKELTTSALAELLQLWQRQNISPCFIIGGADGISPGLKQDGIMQLGLSAMTLPHVLARVMLTEQLYRAVSIINRHPYHRC